MRITCQNCRAQYDIDPSEIPSAGCEVECLGCGKVWYQWPEHDDEALHPDKADAEKTEFVGEAPKPLDLTQESAPPDDSGEKTDFDPTDSTGGLGIPREVAKILEEELIESTKIEKIAARSEEQQQDPKLPDDALSQTESNDTNSPDSSSSSEKPTTLSTETASGKVSPARRHPGDESNGDTFRYGILPVLLLVLFIVLVHFALPVAGELFADFKPYAEAYKTVTGRAANQVTEIIIGLRANFN